LTQNRDYASIQNEDERLMAAAKDGRLIVILDDPDGHRIGAVPANMSPLATSALEKRAALLRDSKQTMLQDLKAHSISTEKDYTHIPAMRVRTESKEAIAALKADERVKAVMIDDVVRTTDTSSFSLVQQPDVVALGLTGSGYSVAILDTGIDYSRAAFGSCTAPGVPQESCRVVAALDFATEDGQLDAGLHGTNVAGIAAEFAPGTKLISLDVFDGLYAYNSSILAAIDWVIIHRDQYKIAAMNLSLGGREFSEHCDGDPLAVGLAIARQAGILSAVAAGNGGRKDGISTPACASSAVSVGAVYDQAGPSRSWSTCTDSIVQSDKVACFSNSSSLLKLLAPGVSVSAAGISMSGTSQATPHVAASIAILKSQYPGENPDELEARLLRSGVPVVDQANNLSIPRLNILRATRVGCSLSVSPTEILANDQGGPFEVRVDTKGDCPWRVSTDASWIRVLEGSLGTGPGIIRMTLDKLDKETRSAQLVVSGGILPKKVTVTQVQTQASYYVELNDGRAFTDNRSVVVGVGSRTETPITQMCISTTNKCKRWQSFVPRKKFRLTGGAGLKTIYAQLRTQQNEIISVSDTIFLDLLDPQMGSLNGTAESRGFRLNWSEATDKHSKIVQYFLMYTQGSRVPAARCTSGLPVSVGSGNTASVTDLTPGTAYTFRLCAMDQAGNMARGKTWKGTTLP
jgi:subtilisin family serine protease